MFKELLIQHSISQAIFDFEKVNGYNCQIKQQSASVQETFLSCIVHEHKCQTKEWNANGVKYYTIITYDDILKLSDKTT